MGRSHPLPFYNMTFVFFFFHIPHRASKSGVILYFANLFFNVPSAEAMHNSFGVCFFSNFTLALYTTFFTIKLPSRGHFIEFLLLTFPIVFFHSHSFIIPLEYSLHFRHTTIAHFQCIFVKYVMQ